MKLLVPQKQCKHCTALFSGGSDFCCRGCEAVYNILQSAGIDRSNLYFTKPASPLTQHSNFSYLDGLVIEGRKLNFFIEGIHCLACLLVIEKLPLLNSEVNSARLDLAKSVVTIQLNENGRFSSALHTLESLGYKPHPIFEEKDLSDQLALDNRKDLIRLGVLAACAGNIMLFTIPIYAGVTGSFARLFGYLSLILFVPALTYGSIPFYKNIWTSLKTRVLSIDIPIYIAVFAGTALSVVELVNRRTGIYFDSLSALIFLLSCSRYLLKKIRQMAFDRSSVFLSLIAKTSTRLKDNIEYQILSKDIRTKDRILVRPGETIPVDGILENSIATINESTLTGESYPRLAKYGETVFSGTINDGSDSIIVEATTNQQSSRLGKLISQIRDSSFFEKTPIASRADTVSQVLVLAVIFTSGLLVFLKWSLGPSVAIQQALALLVVTCPCGLALAVPLVYSLAVSRAAKFGMVVKSADVFERVLKVKNVFFDKTKTLTTGNLEFVSGSNFSSNLSLRSAIISLQKMSSHAVAKATCKYLASQPYEVKEVASFTEFPTQGVAGKIEGHWYKILQKPFSDILGHPYFSVDIFQDNRWVGDLNFTDQIREEAKNIVTKLSQEGLSIYLLSGDSDQNSKIVAKNVGIDENKVYSKKAPEQKLEIVSRFENTMMIGDGANDASALAKADVGIAVQGSLEISLKTASVYLTKPGLSNVLDLFDLSKKVRRVVYYIFGLSFAYNVIGAALAIAGVINPLIATILMPLNSATVICATFLMMRRKAI
ncbi:MAG: heavy metal translocating P-type ATPase [Bacteriovoracia bacterium]